MEGIKTKQFAEGEFLIEGDNLGVELKDKTLFHGSVKPSIEKFMTSEEADIANITDGSTFGLGLYLTSSEKAATAYARKRKSDSTLKQEEAGIESTFYFTKLENLKLLDLRTQENISEFSQKFRTHLIERLRDKSYSHDWVVQNSMVKALEEIERGITLYNIHSLTGYAMAGVFTNFAKQEGYDGAVTIEGGEGYENEELTYTGNHDTYVVFDPTKVIIVDKKKL